MKKKPHFKNISILLADSDSCLSQAVVHCLRAMGFANVATVTSADDAIKAIRTQSVSLLITEWTIKNSSGIELVRYLRYDKTSPNRLLPIIMLTGRGELHDVRVARDAGITEFLVKPFSTKTLYNRLEQIIDNPRSFVFSSAYVGPERRRRGEPPPGVSERRTAKPKMKTSAHDAMGAVPTDMPVIYAPDFTLRKALGLNTPLSQMITPDVLAEAQQAIDVLVKDSLSWISEDLKTLEASAHSLGLQYLSQAVEQAKEASLSIKARSGTFGYVMASDVARLLYLFLSSNYSATNPKHLIVMQKHIDVLKVIFAKGIKVREGIGNELYAELERLIATHK